MVNATVFPTHPFFHRFHHAILRIRPQVLNLPQDQSIQAPTTNLVESLKITIDEIRSQAFDKSTGMVNYNALRSSELFATYRAQTASLHFFDVDSFETTAEQMTFWINLYNMLAIDVVLTYGVHRIINIPHVFFVAGYDVGGLFYSLHDIEQGILRSNAGYPGLPGPQFGLQDPRRKLICKNLDPRIHFALVCAATSCPPIRVYTPEQLDQQLDIATSSFINSDEVVIDLERKRVTLSKIFQWYAPDFDANFMVTLGLGDRKPIIRWLAPYLLDESKRMVLLENSEDFTVDFKHYDWSLNVVGT